MKGDEKEKAINSPYTRWTMDPRSAAVGRQRKIDDRHFLSSFVRSKAKAKATALKRL